MISSAGESPNSQRLTSRLDNCGVECYSIKFDNSSAITSDTTTSAATSSDGASTSGHPLPPAREGRILDALSEIRMKSRSSSLKDLNPAQISDDISPEHGNNSVYNYSTGARDDDELFDENPVAVKSVVWANEIRADQRRENGSQNFVALKPTISDESLAVKSTSQPLDGAESVARFPQVISFAANKTVFRPVKNPKSKFAATVEHPSSSLADNGTFEEPQNKAIDWRESNEKYNGSSRDVVHDDNVHSIRDVNDDGDSVSGTIAKVGPLIYEYIYTYKYFK